MVFSSLDTDSPRLSGRHSCLSCRLDGLTVADREANRHLKLQELGLLTAHSVTLFEEAIQTVARTLDVPICWLTLMTGDWLQLKAATGLSCLGLMNPLATHRQLSRQEAYCTQVVDSRTTLIFPDILTEPLFATGKLYEQYGFRSYLGAPLLSAEGICLGTLAVLDLSPRSFSNQDVAFLTMSARWCLSEFERNHYLAQPNTPPVFSSSNREEGGSSAPTTSIPSALNQIQLKLLHHLIRQLQPDLTAIIGMSSVLKGGMFGQLNAKQGEYLSIIHRSGEKINMAIAEMLQLEAEAPQLEALDLLPVNLELLVQQVVNQLEDYGNQRQLTIRLTSEPGKKVWMLDKVKVKSALYYLLAGLSDSAEPEAEIRVHVARRKSALTVAVWIYHPWVGEGLPQVPLQPPLIQPDLTDTTWQSPRMSKFEQCISLDQIEAVLEQIGPDDQNPSHHLHHWLGLMLSISLCEYHDGQILVQGSADAGYRYVLQWPKIAPTVPSSSESP